MSRMGWGWRWRWGDTNYRCAFNICLTLESLRTLESFLGSPPPVSVSLIQLPCPTLGCLVFLATAAKLQKCCTKGTIASQATQGVCCFSALTRSLISFGI